MRLKEIKTFILILCLGVYGLYSGTGIILPGDNFFPGWKKSSKARFFKKADLFNHINGAAELFLEFGFADLQVQRYRGEKEEISLELYRMENPTAALGIYLYKCGKETPAPGISARNSADPYQFTIVKGNYFLQVNNPSGEKTMLPVMKSLAACVLEKIPAGSPVKLLNILPQRDLIPGSITIARGPYALQKIFFFGEGDILLLKGRVFAAAGDYKEGADGRYTLILIPFPNQQAAASAYMNLVTYLDPYLEILTRRETGFTFKDFQKKYGIVKVAGPFISIKVNLRKIE